MKAGETGIGIYIVYPREITRVMLIISLMPLFNYKPGVLLLQLFLTRALFEGAFVYFIK